LDNEDSLAKMQGVTDGFLDGVVDLFLHGLWVYHRNGEFEACCG